MSKQQAKPAAAEADSARIFAEVAERSSRIMADYLKRQSESKNSAVTDEFGIGKAFMDMSALMLSKPQQLAEAQMNMFWDYTRLWQNSVMQMMGQKVEPVVTPRKGDNRFRDAEWENHFLFDYVKQSYLIAARHIHDAVSKVENLPPDERKKVDFFTRQYIDALSPSNFALTNPEVVRETMASGGQNLLRGLNNLLGDIERGDGQLQISMTDPKAFKMGENIATSPGKVVYQNDLMQLIQYQPSTKKVYKRPLLIIPPWINKYYILDLRESNSFIKWAVDQGHTVFVISWVNPGKEYAGKTFEDYLKQGPSDALDAIEKATGEKQANVIGYCLGGTLLGAALGVMAAKKDTSVASATFFVSLLDFSIPGELGVFIDEKQVENLERRMNERGYLEGSEMAGTFNMLRSNDLVWSFVVNNYLMGKDPFPFDLLYWNSDSTRMPATMHSFYLRNMYLANKLKDPGGISLGGVPVDISKIKIPAYFISTAEDHIAPWKSVYKGARVLSGKVRFVLGGSGHIAGIVNPPAANKYCYWTNPELPESSDDWLATAARHEGSWWPDWQAWMDENNGGVKVAARAPGDGKLKVIEDAPGAYVSLRLGAEKANGKSGSTKSK
ncbi:MAG: class I poly(R)-hydroxyalkanoic acid synthase [Burkholderiales bacterium]|nr:class I poly(R)-hydroxyalkanoic acid synthase [Burkholderiales bacterium]